jgi:hypothetical protein
MDLIEVEQNERVEKRRRKNHHVILISAVRTGGTWNRFKSCPLEVLVVFSLRVPTLSD